MTLHSWAGIGIAEGTFDTIVNKVLSSKRARKHWRRTHVLVIDEISMLDPKIFDLLDRIGRRVRGSSLPFGGLQLIVCGDFAQVCGKSARVYPFLVLVGFVDLIVAKGFIHELYSCHRFKE